MFSLIYFMRIFISSVVYPGTLTHSHVSSILMVSISNALYVLGSIMVGAILLIIIHILQMFVPRNEGSRCSLLNNILLFLPNILKDIIIFANGWIFVHIALYGKSYVKTLK
ncbi:hypothetical protein SLOPH_1844, partial [Spraguea lophii 42_110]